MTLRTVLLSLQALLAAAEPDDPQDAVVAQQYKEVPEIFARTARHWTSVYAGGAVHFQHVWSIHYSAVESDILSLLVLTMNDIVAKPLNMTNIH